MTSHGNSFRILFRWLERYNDIVMNTTSILFNKSKNRDTAWKRLEHDIFLTKIFSKLFYVWSPDLSRINCCRKFEITIFTFHLLTKLLSTSFMNYIIIQYFVIFFSYSIKRKSKNNLDVTYYFFQNLTLDKFDAVWMNK